MAWARVMRGTFSIARAATPRAASASRSGRDWAGCSSPTRSRPAGSCSTCSAEGRSTTARTSAPAREADTDPTAAPAAV